MENEKMELFEKYRQSLAVIKKCEGDFKDYTYLSLLVTETGKLFTHADDFLNSGVLDFVTQQLAYKGGGALGITDEGGGDYLHPGLTTLALSLANDMLQVEELRLQIIEMLISKLDYILADKHYSVLAALLQCCVTIQKTCGTEYCSATTKLFSQRNLQEAIIWSLNEGNSYHVSQLAIKCYLSLLTYLTVAVQEEKDPVSVIQNTTHINFEKIRQNFILDLFDKVVNEKDLLTHLKYLLRNCDNPNLKLELQEFVMDKVKENDTVDYYTVLLLASPKLETAKELMSTEDKKLQQVVLYEATKLLPEHKEMEQLILDFLHNKIDEANFLRFIAREDLTKHFTPFMISKTSEKCLIKWQILWQNNLSETNAVQTLLTIIKFNIRLLQTIDNVKICTETDSTSDNYGVYLNDTKNMLSKFLGVPDNLKAGLCEFLVAVFSYQKFKKYRVPYSHSFLESADFIECVSYLAVNSASSWHLKDSALEALEAILKNGSDFDDKYMSIFKNVILCCLKDGESYVRASSLRLIARYAKAFNITLPQQQEMLTKIEEIMLIDQEAIVRRSAVDTLSKLVFQVAPENMEHLGILGLQAIASDLDWEVKLKSSILWTNIFHRFTKKSGKENNYQLISQNVNKDQLITQLEKIGAFSALLFGCKDYEEPVREAYYKLTETVIQDLDLDEHTLNKLRKLDLGDESNVKSTKADIIEDDEELVDDTIESVVDADDKDLLQILSKQSSMEDKKELIHVKLHNLNSFLQEIHALKQDNKSGNMFISGAGGQHCQQDNLEQDNLETLNSILDDIIRSVSNEGLVETIDCY